MARLPDSFSLQALPIEAALSEGRIEDAKTAICALLGAGKADAVVQRLAASMIKPPPRSRGRRKANTRHWYEIGEDFQPVVLLSVIEDFKGAKSNMGGCHPEQCGAGFNLFPVHLVIQAVPLASLHSSFEGLQHALGPYRGFGPAPSSSDLSTTF